MRQSQKLSVVILISGNGSNLQAIIDAIEKGLPVEIRAVISNRDDAFGLQRAAKAGIPSFAISHQDFSKRRFFEFALQQKIDEFSPELVVLAGFMRKLTPEFIHHYPGRMINIHPSLLPKYPGLHTHRQALQAKDQYHGVSIHYVTEEVDGGPLIYQESLLIHPDDTEQSLEKRIHQIEHRIYPMILGWIAAGKIKNCQNSVHDKKISH